MRLQGRRALVTGGSRGIGLELARSFASRGVQVAICSRAAELPPGLDGFRSQVRHFTCDLSRPEEVEALAGRVRAEWGAPDILVNNAGVQYNHDWAETPAADRARWAQTELSLNTVAPTLLTAFFLDDLRAADPGVVVNVTSLLGLSPKRSAPVYYETGWSSGSGGGRTRADSAQRGTHSEVRAEEHTPPRRP